MGESGQQNTAVIRWLTFLMFMLFAMITDSVGVIIPQVVSHHGDVIGNP
jgi:fucose permease